jgi:NAD(P)-dependent dehydrogenase (short-subunit alcohol dehydrogenase family)
VNSDGQFRSVAVTGAASGIGRGVAEEALARGAEVVWMLDISADRLADVAAEVRFGGAARVEARAVDVAKRESVTALTAEWHDCGFPEAVVNAAGIRAAFSIVNTSQETWDNTIAVNLTGTFNMMQEVASGWLARGEKGVFVAVASNGGEVAFSDRAAYCASKFGVIGLVRAAALDLASKGIRVIAISPGFIATAMSQSADDDFVARTVPLGRRGTPRQLAALLLDVARSELITGASVVADGGLIAGFRL